MYMDLSCVVRAQYLNNCLCMENQFSDPAMVSRVYRASVEALTAAEFDSLKMDACSQFKNLSLWSSLLSQTGRPVLVENCGNGPSPTNATPSCDGRFNFYRVSGDIRPAWWKVMINLQSTLPYLGDPPLSRPHCWAYADMLEESTFRPSYFRRL